MRHHSLLRRTIALAAVAALLGQTMWLDTALVNTARACPFCSATQLTLSEELKQNDVTVICKLAARPVESAATDSPDAGQCTFEVVQVLKGEEHLARQPGATKPYQLKILFYGEQPLGSTFLAFGVDPTNLVWGTPTALSDRGVEYMRQLPKLADSGAGRLAFFQNYFEDADSLLAADAYDEFAKAPYSDLVQLKTQMPREKLVTWINNPNVSTGRRRLYLCMLSVCGQAEDAKMLEGLIRNEDRQVRTALDATIGAYLTLMGPAGMPLVEDMFLKKADAEYTDTYSAIMALRFIGQDTTAIPRERLIEAMRHMLSRPKLADLIIPDLTRWQDWTVMPQLVQLFKQADQESSWVRVPVINYLRACPLPEAKKYIDELAVIDPDAVRRATMFYPQTEAAQPTASGTTPQTPPAAAAAPVEPVKPTP